MNNLLHRLSTNSDETDSEQVSLPRSIVGIQSLALVMQIIVMFAIHLFLLPSLFS